MDRGPVLIELDAGNGALVLAKHRIICAVPDCDRPVRANGFCAKHYLYNWHHGTPNKPHKTEFGVCIVFGCGQKPRSRYSPYCEMHYSRLRRGSKLKDAPARKECRNCGAPINQSGPKRKQFCSDRCCWKSSREQPALYSCVVCGKPFERTTSAKWCSDECAKKLAPGRKPGRKGYHHKTRAKRHGVEFEHFLAEEIFERDGWVCQICKEPVLKDAPPYSPKSVVLDHIVPMGVGGPHTKVNTQCAHFSCNAEKAKGEVKAIAKVNRIIKKRNGAKKRGKPIAKRPFSKSKRPFPRRPKKER